MVNGAPFWPREMLKTLAWLIFPGFCVMYSPTSLSSLLVSVISNLPEKGGFDASVLVTAQYVQGKVEPSPALLWAFLESFSSLGLSTKI